MLRRLNPEKRAKVDKLECHRWMEEIFVQGEVYVTRGGGGGEGEEGGGGVGVDYC